MEMLVMKKSLPITLLLSALLTFGCTKKNEFKAPPPPGVTVQLPEQKTVTVFGSFPADAAIYRVLVVNSLH